MQKHWLIPVLGTPLVVLLIAGGLLYSSEAQEMREEELRQLRSDVTNHWEDVVFKDEEFLSLMDEWHLKPGAKRYYYDYFFYPLENPMEENVASLFFHRDTGEMFVKIPGERDMETGERYEIESFEQTKDVLFEAFAETPYIEYTEVELREELRMNGGSLMIHSEVIATDELLDEFTQMDWRDQRPYYQEFFSENNPYIELKEDPALFLKHFEGEWNQEALEHFTLEDVNRFQEFIELWEGEWLHDWSYALNPDSEEQISSCNQLFATLDRQEDYLAGDFQLPAYSVSHEEGHLLEVETFYYSEGDDEIYLTTVCTESFPYWDSVWSTSDRYVLRFEDERLTDIFSYQPEVTYWDQMLIEWYQFDYDENGERNWLRHLEVLNAFDQLTIPHMEYLYEQAFELDIF